MAHLPLLYPLNYMKIGGVPYINSGVTLVLRPFFDAFHQSHLSSSSRRALNTQGCLRRPGTRRMWCSITSLTVLKEIHWERHQMILPRQFEHLARFLWLQWRDSWTRIQNRDLLQRSVLPCCQGSILLWTPRRNLLFLHAKWIGREGRRSQWYRSANIAPFLLHLKAAQR